MNYQTSRAINFVRGSFAEQGMQTIVYENNDEVYPTALWSLNQRVFECVNDFVSSLPESGQTLGSAISFLRRMEKTVGQLRVTLMAMRAVNLPDDEAVVEKVAADQVDRVDNEGQLVADEEVDAEEYSRVVDEIEGNNGPKN